MLDITLSNFEHDVLDASRRQPVLLDIWAPWCGPCKALGPVLEKLERDYAGRFTLGKLNSDEQPEIAGQLSQMFGVRSIPFCVLFLDGQPVDGFVGALPERELRAFLDKHVQEAAAGDEPGAADRALQLLSAGQVDDAIEALRRALAADPSNAEARFSCLRALIQAGRLEEAREVYAPVAGQGNPATDDLAACGLWLEACERSRDPDPLALAGANPEHPGGNASAPEAQYRSALSHLAASRFTDALEALLGILAQDKEWAKGRARTSFLAILRLLRADEASVTRQDSRVASSASEMLANAPAARSRPSAADTYHRRLSMILF